MNKVVCSECGNIYPTRGGQKFVQGERCSSCGGLIGINIKGTSELYTKMPTETVRIPRRYRPSKTSTTSGAKPSSGHAL